MSTSTSNTGKMTLTTRELVERSKRRRASSIGLTIIPASTINVTMQSPPLATRSAERFIASPPEVASNTPDVPITVKSMLLEFPKGFGADFDQSMWPHLQKLKIGGALAAFESKSANEVAMDIAVTCFKGLQSNLLLASVANENQRRFMAVEWQKKELSRALNNAIDEQGLLKRAVEVLDSKLKESNNRKVQLQSANTDLVIQLNDCQERLKECCEKMALKKCKLINCGSFYSHLARVECMEEHARGMGC